MPEERLEATGYQNNHCGKNHGVGEETVEKGGLGWGLRFGRRCLGLFHLSRHFATILT